MCETQATVAKLSEIVERVITPGEIELVDLRVAGGGKVSVFVDKPGGVNIGECAEISREISVLINIEEIMKLPYTLEVSSPGAERPLTKTSDYEKFSGRRVKVRTKDDIDGRKVWTGRIEGIEDGFVQLSGEGSGGEVFSIPFDDIEKANLKREL